MMTPEEALEYLENHERVTVVESDLSPDDPTMGRAQFLVTPVSFEEEEILKADIEEYTDLEYFNVDDAPDHFRHIALP